MAHTNFTPISVGAAANAETFNAPLGQLSDALDAKETRLAAAEGSIQNLQTQQAADEAAVSALAGRMTDAEGDISALETQQQADEAAVSALAGRVSTAEADIDSLEAADTALAGRMSTAESDIDAVEAALENKASKTSRYLNGMSTGAGGDDTTWYNSDYVVCSTAAATPAKTGAVIGDKMLVKGTTLKIRFVNGNTASGATFTASNNQDIQAVPLNGLSTTLAAGAICYFVYDDSVQAFLLIGSAGGGGGTAGGHGVYVFETDTAATTSDKVIITDEVDALYGDTPFILIFNYGNQMSVNSVSLLFRKPNGDVIPIYNTNGSGSQMDRISLTGLPQKLNRFEAVFAAINGTGSTAYCAHADTYDIIARVTALENGGGGYTLPPATASTLGGVKVGQNLSIDQDGVLSATDTTYGEATAQSAGLMPAADKSKLDGVEAGANAYVLPAASASDLGGVKVGSGLSIDANGVLSASGGGGGSDLPIHYVECDSDAATQQKVITVDGISELTNGMVLLIHFKNGNSKGIYLDVYTTAGTLIKSCRVDDMAISTKAFTAIYSFYDNAWYSLRVSNAKNADKLTQPCKIDGVGFTGLSDMTHSVVCTDTAAAARKILSGFSFYTNYKSFGFYIRVMLQNGNTARTFDISASASGTAYTVYNREGGTEMPCIPAGGWMEIVFNSALAQYQLVNWTGRDQIEAASDTDTALDDLTLNGDYLAVINSVNYKLTNIFNAEDLHEQYLFSRPAAITPGSTAAPVRKYRCREWDSANAVWLGWTAWTAL